MIMKHIVKISKKEKDQLGELLAGGTSENDASENNEKKEELQEQIRALKIEESEKTAENTILKAMVEGKSFENYKQIERPEGDASGLRKRWDKVVQILGNKVNDICRIVGFDEEEWKRLTEDSQNREANIRNILINIDNIIQYQLKNSGSSGEFGMLSSFL